MCLVICCTPAGAVLLLLGIALRAATALFPLPGGRGRSSVIGLAAAVPPVAWVGARWLHGPVSLLPQHISKGQWFRTYIQHAGMVLVLWSVLRDTAVLLLPGETAGSFRWCIGWGREFPIP